MSKLPKIGEYVKISDKGKLFEGTVKYHLGETFTIALEKLDGETLKKGLYRNFGVDKIVSSENKNEKTMPPIGATIRALSSFGPHFVQGIVVRHCDNGVLIEINQVIYNQVITLNQIYAMECRIALVVLNKGQPVSYIELIKETETVDDKEVQKILEKYAKYNSIPLEDLSIFCVPFSGPIE